jgi:hypothetical protein
MKLVQGDLRLLSSGAILKVQKEDLTHFKVGGILVSEETPFDKDLVLVMKVTGIVNHTNFLSLTGDTYLSEDNTQKIGHLHKMCVKEHLTLASKITAGKPNLIKVRWVKGEEREKIIRAIKSANSHGTSKTGNKLNKAQHRVKAKIIASNRVKIEYEEKYRDSDTLTADGTAEDAGIVFKFCLNRGSDENASNGLEGGRITNLRVIEDIYRGGRASRGNPSFFDYSVEAGSRGMTPIIKKAVEALVEQFN